MAWPPVWLVLWMALDEIVCEIGVVMLLLQWGVAASGLEIVDSWRVGSLGRWLWQRVVSSRVVVDWVVA